MPLALPRAALAGQARRLVQHDDVLVLADDRVLDHLGVAARQPRLRARRLALGQGRHADLHARRDAVRRLHPAAVDAHLPGAAHLFDRALRHLRKAPLEPAVQPLLALAPRPRSASVRRSCHHSPRQDHAREQRRQRQQDRAQHIGQRAGRLRHAPTSVTASSEKAEKVVKPPRMPVISKGACRIAPFSASTDDQHAHQERSHHVHDHRAPGKPGPMPRITATFVR